jgi:trigger factor
MNVSSKKISTTTYELTYSVDNETLKLSKEHALKKLSKNVKIQGFRSGKAPAHLIEKSIDSSLLQNEFINEALNHSLPEALNQESLNPVIQPSVELLKFVPYSLVEFKVTVNVLGSIKLPDFKKLGVKKNEINITEEDVNQVLKNLQKHMAEKIDVDRISKNGDQLWIDFEGKDEKGLLVNGASGKDYPIILGSDTFIPGFEKNLVGLKNEDEKTFKLTFPKDYGVSALRDRNVTFTCKINKVQELKEPKIDDNLAKKANPSLSSVSELKEDIKKQLTIERERQAEQEFENSIVLTISNSTEVDIPEELIDEQIEIVKRDLIQNIVYRGLTYQEYLESQNKTEEEYAESDLKPEAKRRLVAGIALSEIADKEGIHITPEELELRLQVLKGQFASDVKMLQELETDDGRRSVASKLLTEKVVAKLKTYA